MMPRIQMYTTRWCGYCVRAKTLLQARGLEFEEIAPRRRSRVPTAAARADRDWTVPQILVDGRPIGGYTELWQLDRDGELTKLAA
jgi:glutaredoxin 3